MTVKPYIAFRAVLQAISILLCVSSLGSAPALAEGGEVKTCPALRVGFIGPLTGPGQAYGVAAKNGWEMAVSEQQHPNITTFFEDDQYNSAKTVSAYRKLRNINSVDVVISIASTPSNAVAPLAERDGVPLIAWASDPQVARGRRFVLRSFVSGQMEGKALADEALRNGYKRIIFVTAPSDYIHSVRDGFLAQFPQDRIALDEDFPGDAKDFRSLLTRAKELRIDAIGICLQPGQGAMIAKQSRELQMNLPIFSCFNIYDRAEIAASTGALLGAWLITDATTPTFAEHYVERYQDDSVISAAALHYDIARLLMEAAAQCVAPQAIISHLLQRPVVHGAVGDYRILKQDNDQFMNVPLVVRRVTKDGFEIVR